MVLPPKKKKSPEIPVFPTILVVLPPESFSRDPSFSHYLGGPSSKKKKILKRSQLFPLSWGSFPPKKKISRDPSFSHYFGVPSSKTKKILKRSQFFPLSWGSFPPPQKKSPEIPVFPTILGFLLKKKKITRNPSFSYYLGVLPPKKISRDPSFSHYLGGPSPPPKKKISRDPSFSHYLGGPSPRKFLQRSQFFPLSWGSFPKKISQEIPAFPTGGPSPPQKKKISRDPSFSHYRGGPSPLQKKKNSPEIPLFSTILGFLPQRSQLFPLSWGSFPPQKKKNLKKSYFFPLFWGPFSKNFLQRSHFFPLSWGSTSKKKKKNQKDIRAGADSALRRLVPV